jgi:hypothetical protein
VQRPTQPLDTKLVKTNRPPGMNTIGMVAWKITMHTPQYPQGRKVIIIANDITHQVGVHRCRPRVLGRANAWTRRG